LLGFVVINDLPKSPGLSFTDIVENLFNSTKKTLLIAGYAVEKF
jgi:hypothetical protein